MKVTIEPENEDEKKRIKPAVLASVDFLALSGMQSAGMTPLPIYHSWGDPLLVEQHLEAHRKALEQERSTVRLVRAFFQAIQQFDPQTRLQKPLTNPGLRGRVPAEVNQAKPVTIGDCQAEPVTTGGRNAKGKHADGQGGGPVAGEEPSSEAEQAKEATQTDGSPA